MVRFPYDRSGKWAIDHPGHLLLGLGGLTGVAEWRTKAPEVVQPRKVPDGLLDVRWEGDTDFSPVILEIETYPKNETPEGLLRDVLLVYADRKVVPDVVVLVLHPKGDVSLRDRYEVASRRGTSRLGGTWRVVEMWALRAADLLATGEPGLMPWVSLTTIEGPVEPVLREARRVIDARARPEEHGNLLAVTQVLLGLNYTDPGLFAIFGGDKAMIESPVLDRLAKESEAKGQRKSIEAFLEARFGTLPEDIRVAMAVIAEEERLASLARQAAVSPDLEAFRRLLTA